VGGGNLEDQSYRQYAAAERAAGRTPMDPVAWKEHSKNVTETKDQAVADLPLINQNLNTSEELIDKLLKDPDATVTAINTPGIFKEGTFAAWGPSWATASEETKTL